MKTLIISHGSEVKRRTRTFAGAGLLLVLMVAAAQAQQFTLNWSTIDGGGGTSTGGAYSVSGTIGQPDAGTMTGGPFTLDGGFWSLIAVVQSPGAPLLSVDFHLGDSRFTISWPLPADGWVLEENTTLADPTRPWSLVPVDQYRTSETHCSFTEPSSTGSRFYRLRN